MLKVGISTAGGVSEGARVEKLMCVCLRPSTNQFQFPPSLLRPASAPLALYSRASSRCSGRYPAEIFHVRCELPYDGSRLREPSHCTHAAFEHCAHGCPGRATDRAPTYAIWCPSSLLTGGGRPLAPAIPADRNTTN